MKDKDEGGDVLGDKYNFELKIFGYNILSYKDVVICFI